MTERQAIQDWEYFAALGFAYHDALEGTDEVDVAWHELAAAIKHWRAMGGPEPRDPDTLRPPSEVTDD